MTSSNLADLAARWIAYWQAPDGSPEKEALMIASFEESDLVSDSPDAAWLLILEILKRDQSVHILEVLSAGPLEDLLSKHGAYVIDRVEAEAKSNAAFASLLGGVWRLSMTEEVWSRVQSAWDRRGWDGIPAA